MILWSFSNLDQDLQEPQGCENDGSGKQILVSEPDPWKMEKEGLVDGVEVYTELGIGFWLALGSIHWKC